MKKDEKNMLKLEEFYTLNRKKWLLLSFGSAFSLMLRSLFFAEIANVSGPLSYIYCTSGCILGSSVYFVISSVKQR